MRHGQSKANEQNIIVSHPENRLHIDYALSDLGKRQAREAAENSKLTKDTEIYASDFSRAVETAEIVQEIIGAPAIHSTEALRERHFGDFEKMHSENYHKVWDVDAVDANHTENNVESVNSVLSRVTKFILDIEEKYSGKDILLVSHGDTLQILQAGFLKVDPKTHHSLSYLKTAEIRELMLA